jgi:glycosyltransferase involved in cell wall biosynthesis
MIVAAIAFAVCAAVVAWSYFGYPAFLGLLGRFRPRKRKRGPASLSVSVIVAAHNEERALAAKLESIRNSRTTAPSIEIVVASDGSTDRTAALASNAGADVVLDLPRVGKLAALVTAVAAASGEVLVFTDADSVFGETTLEALLTGFADPQIGGVSATQRTSIGATQSGLGRGEGLYWRYEEWIRRLEDRVGSTVSACGGLYAIRRELFKAPPMVGGSDDFLISTQVIRTGRRLAFEPEACVWLVAPSRSKAELRRKVRLMNQGLRGAFSLGRLLLPWHGGLYAIEVVSHKIIRRLVPFFLVGALAASGVLVQENSLWWIALGPQVALYLLAAMGAVGRGHRFGQHKIVWIPYYFVLGNVAAAIAVVSVLAGVRYQMWSPQRDETNGTCAPVRRRAVGAERRLES